MNQTVQRVAGTEIIVGGRQHKVEGHEVSYQQVVEIWNELHKDEGLFIKGTPGIDYTDGPRDSDGVLRVGQTIKVQDGTSFSVDPSHVS